MRDRLANWIEGALWAAAWLEPLEANGDAARIGRGRRYLRDGRVAECRISPGEIAAVVRGGEAYHVRIAFKTRTGDVLPHGTQVSGGPGRRGGPKTVGAAVVALMAPKWSEIVWRCTCPDWGDPCKHSAAVWCWVAERIAQNPEVYLTLLGIDENQGKAQNESPGAAYPGDPEREAHGPKGDERTRPLAVKGMPAEWYWNGEIAAFQAAGGEDGGDAGRAEARDGNAAAREEGATQALGKGTSVGWAFAPPMHWSKRNQADDFAFMLARAYAAISSQTQELLNGKRSV